MRYFKVFLIALVTLIICNGIVLAQTTEGKNALPLPDLIIKSVVFVPVPKENGPVDVIRIQVANQGQADASACVLSLSCVASKCDEGNYCDKLSKLIRGDIAVPALKKGENTNIEWKPSSSVIWVSGKYSLVAEIDKYNVVRESNEINNVAKCLVHITTFTPRKAAY